jgi:hypothetical protein
MTKAKLIESIEREWAALEAAIDGLDDRQMVEALVIGKWTVKDILAHIAVWESRLVTDLFKIERGVTPETPGLNDAQVEQLNERYYNEQRDRSLERILEDIQGVHLALLNRLEDFPEKALIDPKKYKWMSGKPLSEWIGEDSHVHYREHAQDIRAWRERLGI